MLSNIRHLFFCMSFAAFVLSVTSGFALAQESAVEVKEELTKEDLVKARENTPLIIIPKVPPQKPHVMPVAMVTDEDIVTVSGDVELNKEDITALSLNDVVEYGLLNNPEFESVKQNVQATIEEKRQARALYFPSVDLSGNAGVEHSDDETTRAGNDPDDTEELFTYDAGVTVTQLLYDAGDTYYENRRQKARIESDTFRLREAAEFIGLSIVEAYLAVLRERELLRVARKNVEDHSGFFTQIEDSVSAGRTSRANLEQARTRVAVARTSLSNTKQNLRFAEADYIRQVGLSPVDLTKPAIPRGLLSQNLSLQIAETLKTNPTVMISDADIDVAKAERKGAYSAYYPQFDLQLNAREGQDLGGVRGRDTSASALVTMDWNLYRGGGDTARVRELKRRELQQKEVLVDTHRQIENRVRDAWAQKVAASEQVRHFATQVSANRQLVTAYQDQFKLGRRTLLDLLDTQNELFISQSNLVNARYAEYLAVYTLLVLRGDLMQALDVTPAVFDAKYSVVENTPLSDENFNR